MNFEEYQSEASQTALYPRRMENLEYPTLGREGEAGGKGGSRTAGGGLDEFRHWAKGALGWRRPTRGRSLSSSPASDR